MFFYGSDWSEETLMELDKEVPFDDQMQLFRNALAMADAGLGLRLGNQVHLAAHGPVGQAVSSAPDLHHALLTYGEFIAVRASIHSVEMNVSKGKCVLTIEIRQLPDDLLSYFAETIMATLTNCIDYFTGRSGSVTEITLAYPETGYADLYAEFFNVPVKFGADENTICFDKSLLKLSSPNPDATLHSQALALCNTLLEERESSAPFSAKVRGVMIRNPGRLWSLKEIADVLGMGNRTLIRRLNEEGVQFQQIKEDVLKQQALSYFTDRSVSVEAVAISLGFSETRSFRRAFKRWFGQTPIESLGRRA